MSTLKKPHPMAIQTIYGWALPNTGELLVSKRGLPNPVVGFKIGQPWKNETVINTSIKKVVQAPIAPKIEQPAIEETVIEQPAIEETVIEDMIARDTTKTRRKYTKKSVISPVVDVLV